VVAVVRAGAVPAARAGFGSVDAATAVRIDGIRVESPSETETSMEPEAFRSGVTVAGAVAAAVIAAVSLAVLVAVAEAVAFPGSVQAVSRYDLSCLRRRRLHDKDPRHGRNPST